MPLPAFLDKHPYDTAPMERRERYRILRNPATWEETRWSMRNRLYRLPRAIMERFDAAEVEIDGLLAAGWVDLGWFSPVADSGGVRAKARRAGNLKLPHHLVSYWFDHDDDEHRTHLFVRPEDVERLTP